VPDVLLRSLEGPVHAERCSATGHWCQKTRPHHTCTTAAAFAAPPTTDRVLPVLCISCCLVGHRRIWRLTSNWLSIRGRQNLRSASDMTCLLPLTHNTFGDRSFSVAGHHVWNSLPADLRPEMQFGTFGRQLKTVLFNR